MATLRLTLLLPFILTINFGWAKQVPKQPEVMFFIAADPGFHFWDSQIDFAQHVARALGFKLEVVHTPRSFRNRFDVVDFAKSTLQKRATLPDLVLTSFWLGSEEDMLKMLHKKGINTISINSDISKAQFTILGEPREKFSNWLGHLSPNDTDVGKQLGQAIVRQSRQQRCPNETCKVNIFAITGLSYSAVSIQRVDGLKAGIAEDKDTRVLNVINANWKRSLVASIMKTVLTRHPDVHGFWVASDIMAYGIQDGLSEHNLTLPDATTIGSIDWSPPTIDKIKSGELDISFGGHFFEAGWALMLYYDYLHGKDFIQDIGGVISTKMGELNHNNIEIMGDFLASPHWSETHLQQQTKTLNPKLTNYSLDAEALILKQISLL